MNPIDPVLDVIHALGGVQSTLDNVQSTLSTVQSTLNNIQHLLDLRQWLANILQVTQVGPFLEALRGYLLSTTNIVNGDPQPFTQVQAIREYEPFTRAIANTALAGVAIWACFRMMWTQSARNHYAVHLMFPRLLLAIVLVNWAVPLTQGVVDINNVLCRAVLSQAGLTDFNRLLKEIFVDSSKDLGSGPGLTVLTTAALVIGFLLLALAYVIRYALLVVLVVMAPLAALCFVLPETHRYAREWGGLFVTSLFMQPMQLMILAIAFALETEGSWPVRHVFALAALWLVFKVPGALHSAGGVGTHAFGSAKLSATHLGRALVKGVA